MTKTLPPLGAVALLLTAVPGSGFYSPEARVTGRDYFYSFDRFALHHVALDSRPTETDASETSLNSAPKRTPLQQ